MCFTTPDAETLECVKKMVETRKNDIIGEELNKYPL
jgi:hypothetical protein